MDDEEQCNTRLGLKLGLGLGVGDYVPSPQRQKDKSEICLDLSFALCPTELPSFKPTDEYANSDSFNDANQNCGRKKLRLTKEQSSMLEDCFKLHTNLNPAQKQALADQLKLKPRQVEVWFQNRRARTKLKQTEIDCELLKKCCESLRDENRRLKKELQELRSLKVGRSSLYANLPKAATILTKCPTCEKMPQQHGGEQKSTAILVVAHTKN